ncbi:MAG: hypothetical protein MUE85_12195 [Microscillaceae bacterium]|jgi:hypothetical protein|nr:hypothetical protein [Microscillaceae bacterium]
MKEKILLRYDERTYITDYEYYKTNLLSQIDKALELYSQTDLPKLANNQEILDLINKPKEFVMDKMLNKTNKELGFRFNKHYDIYDKPAPVRALVDYILAENEKNKIFDVLSDNLKPEDFVIYKGKTDLSASKKYEMQESCKTYADTPEQIAEYEKVKLIIDTIKQLKIYDKERKMQYVDDIISEIIEFGGNSMRPTPHYIKNI